MGIVELIRTISKRNARHDNDSRSTDQDAAAGRPDLSAASQNDQTSSSSSSTSHAGTASASTPHQSTQLASGRKTTGSAVNIALPASAVAIVARADSQGRPVSFSTTSAVRRKAPRPKFIGAHHELSIEELHPYTVATKCKPNDFILIYHDLSDLITTGVKSVISGLNIMVADNGKLRRRALHQGSQASVNGSHSSCKLDTSRSLLKMQQRSERANLVLWWRPLYTLWYFLLECRCLLFTYAKQLWNNKGKLMLFLLTLGVLAAVYQLDGGHQQYVKLVEKKLLWCSYWVLLGVMSSIGLGTGLHTFVLYLGPFIAQVTLAAYECDSLEFPEPPYPNEVVCPSEPSPSSTVNLWTIMSKVRLEAMMWGAGTALGELPPYFMARAAKLSGTEEDMDNDDIEEILDIEEKERENPDQVKELGIAERAKVYVHDLVHRMGFFGILACASIPNPLFDLAGITCGHFLIPFWTFFGATLIGKAVIKMHIQKLFVIFAFSEHHVEQLINLLKYIPKVGPKLRQPFKDYLASQRAKLHGQAQQGPTETPWLAWVFEKIVLLMVLYFILSIINSFAQNYHKRLCKEKREHQMEAGKLK